MREERTSGRSLPGVEAPTTLGRLELVPALDRPDLLAAPVVDALRGRDDGRDAMVAEIDPSLADTAAFCERYEVDLDVSANCVVVAGRRGDDERVAACVVLATTRADVNGFVRRRLDVRKASFLSMDEATARTGMAYGGITPIALPADWPVLVDTAVTARPYVVIGSGIRRSKLLVPSALLAATPEAEVHDGLARPAPPSSGQG